MHSIKLNASEQCIFDMLMYADDTTIYCNINQNLNEIVINAELEKVYKWLCSNKLSLNIKKTKFIIFFITIKNKYNIQI